VAIDPDTVSGEQERDSGVSVHTDGRERISLMEPYKGRIAPVGEGLTGRGVEHPPPLSLACHRDTVLTSGSTHLSPECCLCKNIPGVERGLWRWRFTGPIFLIFDGRPGGRRRVAQILYIPSLITSSYETYKR